MEKLALHGGTPVRGAPLPGRAPFGEDDLKEVAEALRSQDLFYTAGNKVTVFEREFAGLYGVRHAIACSSGTAAVHMAVAAIDADPGGEVITAPVTDFGTVAGLLFQGLVPVFADWAPDTFNMDPSAVERLIGPRTRAVIAVHLFGNPCDLDALRRVTGAAGVPLIEDCAQAYCTPYKGTWAGKIGRIGCFSMQQSKHLPAGEGGVTITDDDDLAMRMTLFRDKGWENRGRWGARAYTFLGLNYRMNELTGAVARAQLRKVEGVVRTMSRLGRLLTDRLRGLDGLLPCPVTPGAEHSYWLYAFRILSHEPQAFVRALQAEGVPAAWGYTVKPIYLCTEALSRKRTFGSSSYPFGPPFHDGRVEYAEGLCPVAERELLSIGTLRIYESWTEADVEDVARAFRKVQAGLERE